MYYRAVMAKSAAYQKIGIEAGKLLSLAEELQHIAEALMPLDLADTRVENPAELSEYTRLHPETYSTFVDLARDIYRSRRARARVFSDDALFGEPAWDMLLDLFIAEADGKPLSITAACIGAAVPTSTALRWLVILEERGLVRRENDPRDARRVFLHLTSEGHARMTGYFMQLQREGVSAG